MIIVRHVTQANDSLLYIGTYAGLQTLNLSTGEFTDYEYDLNVEAAIYVPSFRCITTLRELYGWALSIREYNIIM